MRIVFNIILFVNFLFFLTHPGYAADRPQSSGIQLEWLDKKVSPDQDFYQYANGTWRKQHPIPSAYPTWGVAHVLREQNTQVIHNIILDLTKKSNPSGSIEQKISDFYQSGMDETALNQQGISAIQPELERIQHIRQFSDLQKEIAHLELLDIDAPFTFDQMQDFNHSQQVIGVASQAELGLPDRDYYLNNDQKFKDIRKAYLNHITRMFRLLGESPDSAYHIAHRILKMETTLAKASLSRIEQRDPKAIYHMMTVSQLQKVTPHFDWQMYFTDLGYPNIKQINLATPGFFASMDKQLLDTSLTEWKDYLRWRLIEASAPYLSNAYVNESFVLQKTLTGTQTLLPRWRRVVDMENQALGFAVGKLYVEKMFPPSSKSAIQDILNQIHQALEDDLKTVTWLTPETRQAALTKLNMMHYHIGYPQKWRDYSSLVIDRGPYILNILRAAEFQKRYQLNKIDKPVDNDDWDMIPQEVNAYYNPSKNEFNLLAGILQPPYFNPHANSAVNYGAIGAIIGHEMTHAFDDEGAQFDGQGNLHNWWTQEDLTKFKVATACIANQFSQFKVHGMAVQGKLVSGEAIADLSGMILAYNAFHKPALYQQAVTLDGFTPDQQFFIGAAQSEASNMRLEESQRRIITDPHPPSLFRVNGTLANMPQFQQTYAIKTASPMVNPNRCVIW